MQQHGCFKMKQWSVYFINSISVILCIYILLQQMNGIYSYVIAISKDEIKGTQSLHCIQLPMILYLRLATPNVQFWYCYNINFKLLLQSMIALMMHCYNVDYNTAAEHYISRTLPKSTQHCVIHFMHLCIRYYSLSISHWHYFFLYR